MATEHEQHEIMAALRGTQIIDWHAARDQRQLKMREFMETFDQGEDLDKKYQNRWRELDEQERKIMERYIRDAFPDQATYNAHVGAYDIAIMITPRSAA